MLTIIWTRYSGLSLKSYMYFLLVLFDVFDVDIDMFSGLYTALL